MVIIIIIIVLFFGCAGPSLQCAGSSPLSRCRAWVLECGLSSCSTVGSLVAAHGLVALWQVGS